MKFDVYGPFKLLREGKNNTLHSKSTPANFVKQLESETDSKGKSLAEACGCYVFAIKGGKGGANRGMWVRPKRGLLRRNV